VAHIFKHPIVKAKGIIVFTHKEMNWFFPKQGKIKLLKSLAKKPSLKKGIQIIKSSKEILKDFEKIRKHYFIGVHMGWDPSKISHFENCDFYLASDVFDNEEKNDIMRIPLVSRNFTPIFFNNRNYKKYWDILCISRNPKFKNLEYFLMTIRKIFDLGFEFKVLLICPMDNRENTNFLYTSLMDDYYKLFSFSERQNFTVLRLSSELEFLGLSHEVMAFFYNSSKIFTLFSQLEGGPKVISEALCCGLPVVVNNNLRGGGKDYLNEENSMFFSSYDKVHETLIACVENFEKFKISSSKMREDLGEEHSLEKLKKFFIILYEKNDQKFDGKLINTDRLNLRLPAQLNDDIAWTKGRYQTADILSKKQLDVFLNSLNFETFLNNN